MSTWKERLEGHLAEKRIHRFHTAYLQRDHVKVRQLFLTDECIQLIPLDDEKMSHPDRLRNDVLHSARRAMLGFVTGDLMEETVHLTHLTPPPNDIWELKVIPQDKSLQHRIFGWFPEKDCFIATHLFERNWLKTRKDADNKWEEAMCKCHAKRTKLFGSPEPIHPHGRDFEKYVSNGRAAS